MVKMVGEAEIQHKRKKKIELPEKKMKEAQKWKQPWLEFDMLREYDTSKIEEKIWREVSEELNK